MTDLSLLKTSAVVLVKRLYCHRVIYAALALCHGSECVLTVSFGLSGAVAVLYGLLALRG